MRYRHLTHFMSSSLIKRVSMQTTTSMPAFHVIGAKQIAEWLEQNPESVFDAVQDAYLQHADGAR